MLGGAGDLGEERGELLGMQRTSQRLLERIVSLLPLHCEGLVEEVAGLQVVEHEVEQVDVLDPQPWLLLGDVVEQEPDVLPDPEFVLGRVVEDVEGDLVADPAAAEEVVGDEPRQNLIEPVGQRVAHGNTWMQRSTYASS